MPTIFDKLGPFTEEEELKREDALKLLGATTSQIEKFANLLNSGSIIGR